MVDKKASVSYYWDCLCDKIDIMMDMRDFYCILLAFAIF